jgi:hypothetical protein
MSIDRFDLGRFEVALPRIGPSSPLWTSLGIRDGEYAYIVPVRPGVLIYIRSSVRADGLAAESAKDSIRCWLASDDKGAPLGSKDSRWVTRVNGWEGRLIDTLRKLWRLGHQLEKCPLCGMQCLALKVKKPGPNLGRWFSACPSCANGFQKWLVEAPAKKEAA